MGIVGDKNKNTKQRAFSVQVHMAEDDDEDAFGEFSFSSYPYNFPPTLHSQSNGLNSLPAAADDDEWGDFVKSPHQSQASDPHIHGFFGKGNSSSRDLASPTRWVKPSGALPLSIFGEEDDKDLADFNQGRSNAVAGDLNSKFADNNVSNSMNLGIASLYSRTSQIKPENRPHDNSTSKFDLMPNDSSSVQNGFHSSSNQNLARSDFSQWKKVSFDGAVGRSGESELIKNENDEFSSKSNAWNLNQNASLFGGWNLDFNEINPNSNTVKSAVISPSSNLDMNGGKQELSAAADDDGDDGWEFKDAYSESRNRDVNEKVDFMAREVSAESAHSPGGVSGSKEALNLFSTSNGIIDLFSMPTKSVDFFAKSTGISSSSQEVDLTGVHSSTENLNGFISDTKPKFKQNDMEGTLIPSSDVGSTEFDEDFGEFTAACAEAGPKPGEASKNDILGSSKDTVSVLDGKIKEKDAHLNSHKGALPLSIFGNEESEIDGCLDVQDPFMHQSTSDPRHGHTPKPVISINDLISSLYSQTEKIPFSNTTQEPTTIQLNLSNLVSDSNLVNNAEQLDETSWDFKDAFSQTRVDNETSLYSIGDTYLSSSSNLKLNNYLDFYNKLKGELCFVAKYHIDSLKESRGNAALSGENASMASLVSEFQLVCEELGRMNYLFKEHEKQDHPSGNNCLDEFVKILLEPQFQILESEYHLSEKLLLVGKDMKSAMELIKHTITMLKILTIGTSEEQTAYISIWSEMISICAQEIKHGALIWNQATKKHVQSQLLAETQGKNFVLALGEIYRVVVVLGASAKLFKPWIISCSVDSSGIYLLLQECDALWLTSGLEDALVSVSVPTALDDSSLFKSIKDIRGLDAVALENYLLTEKYSLCRLSMLTAGVAPGMKMIMWGEDQCFVRLANLWANLISCNPPKLPRLHIG